MNFDNYQLIMLLFVKNLIRAKAPAQINIAPTIYEIVNIVASDSNTNNIPSTNNKIDVTIDDFNKFFITSSYRYRYLFLYII